MEFSRQFLIWLNSIDFLQDFTLVALPGDASFRRYSRVYTSAGTFIAVDASAEKESCQPFVTIASNLRANKLLAPEVFAEDLAAGFLLLTDFGDDLYLKNINSQNADQLYHNALIALSNMRNCSVDGLPIFSHEVMLNELNLFREWFLEKYLTIKLSAQKKLMLDDTFNFLIAEISSQPNVFMHRDYHSANLLILPENNVGIIDFQDACLGPITYDLVSLLRDCYVDWPEAKVIEWALSYKKMLNFPQISSEDFLYWFDLTGLQRHLKALMIFSRKYCRDGSENYLQHIPLTLNYALKISKKYSFTADLFNFLMDEVLEKCEA